MSDGVVGLDSAWVAAHPLPVHGQGTTKDSRGRVLAIGGSGKVPGALRLTAEAALRVGAGKVQMATVVSAAVSLGLLVPEAATIALPEGEDGEIGDAAAALAGALDACDTLVLGPGIGDPAVASRLLRLVLDQPRDNLSLVIDAMAIGCLKDMHESAALFSGRLIITPNQSEMAVLTGSHEEQIETNPQQVACDAAQKFGAVVVLKGSDTVIAVPNGEPMHYGGGGTGMATGGSGDVLAGAIGGLLSRGAPPPIAAGWGVWLHGQSGRRLATSSGPIGFLAREIPAEIPRLLPQ